MIETQFDNISLCGIIKLGQYNENIQASMLS